MDNQYSIDNARLIEQLARFVSFVHHTNGKTGPISFRDRSGFLGSKEDYKSLAVENARKELQIDKWRESDIGTGEIGKYATKAINKARNLVNLYQQIEFKNRLNKNHPKFSISAEQALYNLYCKPGYEISSAFNDAVNAFGAKYDLISFLFFIKDDTNFLPVSPRHFDEGFASLNIDFKTSHRCSWDNYLAFIKIIKRIYSVMTNVLPMDGVLRLIDAHSFVWIIQQERFINWQPTNESILAIEESAENSLQNIISGHGGTGIHHSNYFIHSAEVNKATKKRAHGICQLCNSPAPFIDKNGNPFLEVHHVKWLSRGGSDSTDNTVALCPNCHRRVHILDLQEDIDKLKTAIEQSDNDNHI